MSNQRGSDSETDWMFMLAGWIKDYCESLGDEIAQKKQRIDSRFTQHHISQWVESILTYMAQSTKLPCPSCEELISLQLDTKQMADIITSILKNKQTTEGDGIDFIINKIEESAGAHQVPCKDHNKDCPFSHKGWIALSELSPEM